MLFFQVVIGGITRLTESGLSIVEWEPIKGALLPMTEEGWLSEFEKYKESPQYREINEGISMSDFKFIYFWEWFHRNWARFMGLVFAIPFVIFYFTRSFDKHLVKRLGGVVLLAGLAASFGWIMVKSGLYERPWVNAYKLAMHLCIAFTVFSYLLWTYLDGYKWNFVNTRSISFSLLKVFMVLLWIQLFVGGVMSGMKAGIYFPTWPDIGGEFVPSVILDASQWSYENFNYYERSPFMPALIQLIHRTTAYTIFFLGIWLGYKGIKASQWRALKVSSIVLIIMILVQVLIGIITVLSCQGEVPISWGVLHQAGGLLLLTGSYIFYFLVKRGRSL